MVPPPLAWQVNGILQCLCCGVSQHGLAVNPCLSLGVLQVLLVVNVASE